MLIPRRVAATIALAHVCACSSPVANNPEGVTSAPSAPADSATASTSTASSSAGCATDADCDPAMFCDLGGDCSAPGECSPKPPTCAGTFFLNSTVCTCNGKTSDACGARYGRESIRYEGACTTADLKGPPPPRAKCTATSDCGDAEKCCGAFSSAETVKVCTADPKECAWEACTNDASCPAGQRCEQGSCTVPAHATCGSKVCPQETPSCVLGKGVERCARRSETFTTATLQNPVLPGVYDCVQPSDCGEGYSCCSGGALAGLRSSCQVTCDASNASFVCATDADCDRFAAITCKDAACKKAVHCATAEPINGEVPRVRVCRQKK